MSMHHPQMVQGDGDTTFPTTPTPRLASHKLELRQSARSLFKVPVKPKRLL